jgi:hypothetical protein
MSPQVQPKSSMGERVIASCALLALAGVLIAVRYVLFEHGILYGQTVANMASLAVAGFIVAAGCLSLWILRGGNPTHGRSSGQSQGDGTSDSVVATVAAILGLALTAYSISQLVAPNTPVAASVPACAGVPVYGAKYFAVTALNGENARSGPGPEYQQLSHYPTGCTLGFDGYCVGVPETDFIAGTPDQRWLLLHDRRQLVSAAFVVSESAESDLGTTPDSECASLGGSPQPHTITKFTYNTHSGELSALAPGAVLVGYSAVSLKADTSGYAGALGTTASSGFRATLPPSALTNDVQVITGQVLLGAAVCLAINVPVADSLRAQIVTLRNSTIIREEADTHVSPDVAKKLADFACDQ